MRHYYKAKEFVLNQLKNTVDYSYEINKHVINTAYYAVKHDLTGEDFDKYLDDITEKTHKKLYCCGCQCSIDTPLGKRISEYEGGGYWSDRAREKFKFAVKKYYEDLYLYNSSEEDGINDGKQG